MLLIISAAVTLAITGIAGYFGKTRVKDSKDFIAAGNKLGIAGVTSMLMGSIIGGVSIATVLISSIATGAGLALGIATMFTRDVYKELIDKKASDKKQMFVLRAVIILVGVVTFVIVIKNNNSMILD